MGDISCGVPISILSMNVSFRSQVWRADEVLAGDFQTDSFFHVSGSSSSDIAS
jgi:hypothetical protein